MSSTTESLEAVTNAFKLLESKMYCSGVVPLEGDCSSLFYRKADGTCESLDFLDADDAQLEALAGACEAATFGRDQEDVLDEEYRKAGKMDSAKFSAQFSVHTSGILDTIVSALVKEGRRRDIRAELYKLNVYGPGSFFKPHVDTPRSDSMFGSLVLVFPTKHEGGALQFRHSGQQWSFESSQLVSSEPCIAFAAFFSDVEHEVLPVTSGYRVTLTYNLYWASKREQQAKPSDEENPFKDPAKALLSGLLADPDFLRDGGIIGFGLTHLYPVRPRSTKLSEIRLKGGDATVKKICDELSLTTGVRALYRKKCYDYQTKKCYEKHVLMKKFADLGWGDQIEFSDYGATDYVDYLYKAEYALKVLDSPEVIKEHSAEERGDNNLRVALAYWIKPLTMLNEFQSTFISYGNEATTDVAYGEICLVAEIAPAAERLSLAGSSEGVANAQASTEANPPKPAKIKKVATTSAADSPPADASTSNPFSGTSPVASSNELAKAKKTAAKGKRATPTEGVRKSTRTRKQAE